MLYASPRYIRRLRTLHENVARDFGAALSILLRTSVEAHLAGVDEIEYGSLTRNLETPACFFTLKAEPFNDRLMLDVDPKILHPMIDRLLGGLIEEQPTPKRPLTEIESCLASRIARLFLEECQSAWQQAIELNLEILQLESNPRPMRILPDDEGMVVIEFELSLGGLGGRMRFCLPSRTVENVGPLLPPDQGESFHELSDEASPFLEVTLAETQIDAEALADLRVGDIIATETPIGSPAMVLLDGDMQFRGTPGVFRGRRAVRLTDAVAESEGTASEDG